MDADHRHAVSHLTAYRDGEPLPALIAVARTRDDVTLYIEGAARMDADEVRALCTCGSVARMPMRGDEGARFVWERPS